MEVQDPRVWNAYGSIGKVNPEMGFLLTSNAALKVSCLVGGH